MGSIHERGRKNRDQSRPRNVARIIVKVISPDHRTKGQEPTQITSQHTRNYPRNPYPQLSLPISLRRSQGKNRAFAGSSTIGRQVNQRIQSGILGARDGRIWPRNREGEGGGSDWHGTTSPNNDVGRKRERLLLGRATAGAARQRVYCFVYVPFVVAGMRCRREAAWGQRRRGRRRGAQIGAATPPYPCPATMNL